MATIIQCLSLFGVWPPDSSHDLGADTRWPCPESPLGLYPAGQGRKAEAVRLWGLSALPSSASTGVDSLLPFFHLFLLYPLFLSRSPCFQTQFRNAVRASLFRGRRQESKHETALLYRMAPQLALSVASVNSVSGHAARGMATDTIYLWARLAPDYSI